MAETNSITETVRTPIEDIPNTIDFFNEDISLALEDCIREGYSAQYAPFILEKRIELDRPSRVWNYWHTTGSLKATGRTKWGHKVVIYAHVPNYFSNPENIKTAFKKGLIRGAGIMPHEEFLKLLELNDEKNVFVIDYKKFRNCERNGSGLELEEALKHPQTIPFCAGEEKANKYLARHAKIMEDGVPKINVCYSNDLADEPVGRLLEIANYCSFGLAGDINFDYKYDIKNGVYTKIRINHGRFLGIKN